MNDNLKTDKLPEGVRNSALSMVYLLLGFLLSWLPMPGTALALIPLVLSFYYGVRYVQDLRRMGKREAIGPNIFGLGLTALLIAMVAAPLVQYQRTMDYQKCLWGANTNQATEACQTRYNQHPGSVQRFFLD